MKKKENTISRRNFLALSVAVAGASILDLKSQVYAATYSSSKVNQSKQKIALVGTGVRGVEMWGNHLIRDYSDQIHFVGLSDINLGRLEVGKDIIGASCPTYVDFEKMMRETKPDTLIVTTDDDTHDHFINSSFPPIFF